MFDIRENLKKLPACPGVYLHKDRLGEVIYVGKALSLKNRVRQYFQSPAGQSPKVRSMVKNIASFEYITCATEMEALILECNLIKKYRPRYNVLLRDDKTYPYIEVTTEEEYPRVIKTRLIKYDGNRYFGPYSDAGAVNTAVNLLSGIYSLKRCKKTEFQEGHRLCLNYHIGECKGVCTGQVSREEYLSDIEKIIKFLSGGESSLIKELKKEMEQASEELRYEEAAALRDKIRALEKLMETQRVTLSNPDDMDIVLTATGPDAVHVVVFYVRTGKLSGREIFEMSNDMDEDNGVIVSAFIKQYYNTSLITPPEILVNCQIPEKEVIESFLSEEGRKVKINRPQRGEKKALMDMAVKDTLEMIKTLKDRVDAEKAAKRKLFVEMERIIKEAGGTDIPHNGQEYRVEAYDISNTNGVDSVGAMVVYEGHRKVKKDYRRFRIKTVKGPDDYESMREMLRRRLKRGAEGDPAFAKIPDLIIMDGGKGHTSAALQVIREAGMDIPVIGLAKDDFHRTRAVVFPDGREEVLKKSPFIYRYFGNIQEEVHRFAIEYHRKVRGKRVIGSVLDNIEGIGPKRRNRLLKVFGSVDKIKKTGVDELVEKAGLPESVAENVVDFFAEKE